MSDSNLTVSNGQDLNIVVAGGGDQTLIASCEGTGADALQITASAGGMILQTSTVAKTTDFKGHNGTGVVSLGQIGSVAASHMMGFIQYVNKHVTFSAATTFNSGALAQPANTILTNIGMIATTAVGIATGATNTNLTIGTSDGGNQIVTTTLIGSSSTEPMASGTGISLIVNQFPVTENAITSLTPTVVANSQYTTSARDIHFRLTNDANDFNAGKICFFIEYMHVLTT